MFRDVACSCFYRRPTNFVRYESHINAKIELAVNDKKNTVIPTSEEGDDYKVDFTQCGWKTHITGKFEPFTVFKKVR